MPVYPTIPAASPSMTPSRRAPAPAPRSVRQHDGNRSFNYADMSTPVHNMSAHQSTPMAPRKSLRMSNASMRPALSDRLATASSVVWPSTINTPVTSHNIRTPSAPSKTGRFSRRAEGSMPHQMVESTPSRVAASFGNLDMNTTTPTTPFQPTKRAKLDSSMVSLSDRLNTSEQYEWSAVSSDSFVASDSLAALESPLPPRSDSRRVSLSERMTNSSRLMQGQNTTDAGSRLPTTSDRLRETPTRRWNYYHSRRRNALNASFNGPFNSSFNESFNGTFNASINESIYEEPE